MDGFLTARPIIAGVRGVLRGATGNGWSTLADTATVTTEVVERPLRVTTMATYGAHFLSWQRSCGASLSATASSQVAEAPSSATVLLGAAEAAALPLATAESTREPFRAGSFL